MKKHMYIKIPDNIIRYTNRGYPKLTSQIPPKVVRMERKGSIIMMVFIVSEKILLK